MFPPRVVPDFIKCSRCKQDRPSDQFSPRASKINGRDSHCNICRADYEKNTRDKARERERKRRRNIRAFIDSHKQSPCADCGESYPPYCMDFDHLDDNEKHFNISQAVTRTYNLDKIAAEIAKCDLVCAICHRKRSYQRANNEEEISLR